MTKDSALQTLPTWIPVAGFLALFVVMWLIVCTMLSAMSGWFELQAKFPDRPEHPLKSLYFQSGSMGLGVSFGGCLTLSACPSGLRVGVWRILGPFSKPFFVPWADIATTSKALLIFEQDRLGFGRPEVGRLTLDAMIWRRLATHAPGMALASPPKPPSRKDSAKALFLQWILVTALAAMFFSLPSLLGGDGPPLAVAIGFPAVVFGIGQAVRFLSTR